MVGMQFELPRVCVLGSWVVGTNMQCVLFVTLQLEGMHHVIERCAGERTRRSEPPATFGATKTPKTLLLNPYQFPAHGASVATTTLSDRGPAPRLPSRDSGVPPDCSRNLWAHPNMCMKNERSVHAPIWTVCQASYGLRRFLLV